MERGFSVSPVVFVVLFLIYGALSLHFSYMDRLTAEGIGQEASLRKEIVSMEKRTWNIQLLTTYLIENKSGMARTLSDLESEVRGALTSEITESFSLSLSDYRDGILVRLSLSDIKSERIGSFSRDMEFYVDYPFSYLSGFIGSINRKLLESEIRCNDPNLCQSFCNYILTYHGVMCKKTQNCNAQTKEQGSVWLEHHFDVQNLWVSKDGNFVTESNPHYLGDHTFDCTPP